MNDSTNVPQPLRSDSDKPRGRWFGRVTLFVWFVGIVASGSIAIMMDDRAYLVLITCLSLFFGALFSLVWFVWFSTARANTRRLTGRIAVASFLLLLLTVRIDEVTGGMRPSFRFAWRPKPDRRLAKLTIAKQKTSGVDLATNTPNDFPQFLGPDRSGRIDGPAFATNWQTRPPKQVWRQPIGAGWSSFAIVNGYAVTMEQRGDEEIVACYEVATGHSKWAHSLPIRHETLMGGVGPRSTPTIDEGRVYAIGATGVMRCLDGTDGSLIWKKDLVTQFGGTHDGDTSAIFWGRAGSPLILRDMVIAPSGSNNAERATLAAFDKVTGELIWAAGDAINSYSSPVVATIAGVEQIIFVAQDIVLSFKATSGEQLWSWKWPGKSGSNANVSQPHAIDHDRVFISKGYGHGCELLQITISDDKWQVESVWYKPTYLKTKFSNVVIHNGLAFGLDDMILECIDVETGTKKWKKGRYGFGQVLGVGDLLLVQAEDGRIVLVEATNKYKELAQFDALQGKTWNNPAIYGRYLLVRNAQEAACYEMPLAE